MHVLTCNQVIKLYSFELLSDLFGNVTKVFELIVRVLKNGVIARAVLSRSQTWLGQGCVPQRHRAMRP
jgi:hypothetical protein